MVKWIKLIYQINILLIMEMPIIKINNNKYNDHKCIKDIIELKIKTEEDT